MNVQVFKEWSKVAALVTATVLFGSLTYGTLVGVHLAKVDNKEIPAAVGAAVGSRVDTEINYVNKDLLLPIVVATNADLGEAHKLIFTANVSAMEAGKAAMNENKMLTDLNPEILSSVRSLNTTVTQAGTTLAGIQKNADSLTTASLPVVNHLNMTVVDFDGTVRAGTTSLNSFNTVITNPSIPLFFSKASDTAVNVDKTSYDVSVYVHNLTHPTFAEKAWTYTITGIGTAAKFFVP